MVDILVRTYNSEKTIKRCLNSLFAQSYKDIKVIVSDDKSSDNTVKIIKTYFPQVELHTNFENLGAGMNRKKLIEYSSSELVTFVDADDWLDSDYLQVLIKKMGYFNADVVKASKWIYYTDKIKKYDYAWKNITNKTEIVQTMNLDFMSNYLFKRKLFDDIKWFDKKNCEDGSIIIQIAEKTEKLFVTNKVHYNWDRRTLGISTTNKKNINWKLNCLHASLYRYFICDKYNANPPGETLEKRLFKFYDEIKSMNIDDFNNFKTLEYIKELGVDLDSKYFDISKIQVLGSGKNDTLIISMTSYPARIKYVYEAYMSILKQVGENDCKCVLVLCSLEFPDREKSLPKNLQKLIEDEKIELIWTSTNTKSHKKIIPTLFKYPNNPILVTDDDVVREKGWLEMFINDHKKYPNDILAGTITWYFDSDLKLLRFKGKKCKNSGTINGVPNIVYKFARPANGIGGTLYPAGTFSKFKDFFNEQKYMKISPTSDESWQFLFDILGDRNIRQTSKIFDNSKNFLNGTQEIETSLHKINKYDKIFNNIILNYPEFPKKIKERQKQYIISFTTYKERLEAGSVDKMIKSLFKQTLTPYKIVMTLYKEDVSYITNYIQNLINSDKIKLIIADKNLKPHLKYFYAMQMFRDFPIITVDDDIEYTIDMCETLVNSYIKHPDCVSARRVHKMLYDKNGELLPYNNWSYQNRDEKEPSFELFATGVGGVLYPPDILNINSNMVTEIKKCLLADDIYLKYLENNKNVKVVYVPNKKERGNPINDAKVQETALYKKNVKENLNDEYIKKFNIIKK